MSMEVTSFSCVRMRSLSPAYCGDKRTELGTRSNLHRRHLVAADRRRSHANLTHSPQFSPKILPKNRATETPGHDSPRPPRAEPRARPPAPRPPRYLHARRPRAPPPSLRSHVSTHVHRVYGSESARPPRPRPGGRIYTSPPGSSVTNTMSEHKALGTEQAVRK